MLSRVLHRGLPHFNPTKDFNNWYGQVYGNLTANVREKVSRVVIKQNLIPHYDSAKQAHFFVFQQTLEEMHKWMEQNPNK